VTAPIPRLAGERHVDSEHWIDPYWAAWRGHGEHPARLLLLLAGAFSFLSAAGTVHAVYTLQPSYILAAAGVAIGAPWVVSGWMHVGTWLRCASVALLAVYLVSLLAGHPLSVPGSPRTGRTRELIYIADLCVGLGTAGAIAGLWHGSASSRAMPDALLAGGLVAATYAVYQWFGLHFHWPFTHVNNTLNSNGVTSEASQGIGVLGWERAQGTFLEPHFLGAYLASLLPLCAASALGARRPWVKRCLWAGGLVMLAALLSTDSAPAWGSLALLGIAGVGLLAVLQGRPVRAALAVSAVVGALALLPVVGTQRATALGTGRSAGTITLTTQFRTATWSRAIELWAQKPILGAGPGQASVRLTVAGVDQVLFQKLPPGVLLSSQGLWAAVLLDTGLLGLAAWLSFLGGVTWSAVRSLRARPDYPAAALLIALGIALFGSLTAGDRLELWVWLLLGAALAAARRVPGGAAGEPS
jgi:O-Antigen ligase